MVEGAHRLDDVLCEFGDLELVREEVQVEEGADVLFLLGVAEGARVEPADEELEGGVLDVGHAEGFGGRGFVVLVVEGLGEKGGVVAEEFLVQVPVCGFLADVDVDHRSRKEPKDG